MAPPTSLRPRWLWPLAWLAAMSAQAQPAAPPARPDPLDPQARVPALVYESAFARYRRAGEEKPIPWRDANDTVGRIGGWRVYTREAQQADPAPAVQPVPGAVAPAQPSPNGPGGHSGHKMP